MEFKNGSGYSPKRNSLESKTWIFQTRPSKHYEISSLPWQSLKDQFHGFKTKF